MGIPRLKWGRLQQMAVQVETVLLIKDQNRPTLLIPQQPKIEGNYLAGILSAVGEIRELPGISTSKGILKQF